MFVFACFYSFSNNYTYHFIISRDNFLIIAQQYDNKILLKCTHPYSSIDQNSSLWSIDHHCKSSFSFVGCAGQNISLTIWKMPLFLFHNSIIICWSVHTCGCYFYQLSKGLKMALFDYAMLLGEQACRFGVS